MKREYAKPFLAVESFQLDAAIAGACADQDAVLVLNHGVNDCTLKEEMSDEYIFGQACEVNTTISGDSSDKMCYQATFTDITGLYLES